MDSIGQRTGRWVLAVLGAVLLLGGAALLVRLLPWLLDARVSWRVIGKFAWGVGLATLEAAAVVALLLGSALASASWQDRGEGLALLLSGASPWSLSARAWWVGGLVALLGFGAGQIAQREAAQPGAVVSAWIDAARDGCDGRSRRVSEVPGLGVSWLCEEGEEPWLVVALGSSGVVQARRWLGDPTGERWELQGVRWSLRGPPEVELTTRTAALEGVHLPWGGGRPRPWLAASAWLGAWLLGGSLLATGEGRRWIAAALGALCAGLLLVVQGESDGGRLGASWLVVQPALAVGPGLVWWWLRRR